MPAASVPSGRHVPVIVSDRQNSSLKDVPIIAISDTPTGPSKGQCGVSMDTPGVVLVSSLNLVLMKTPQVIVAEEESTDPGSDPKLTSCVTTRPRDLIIYELTPSREHILTPVNSKLTEVKTKSTRDKHIFKPEKYTTFLENMFICYHKQFNSSLQM